MVTGMPFELIKPIRGGPPLTAVYRHLESSPDWMCQAKLNGQRVLWDGKSLWSRHGNRLDNTVSEALQGCTHMLDGELIRGKELFVFDLPQEARSPLSVRWERINLVIRDVASECVRKCPSVSNWEEVTANGWEGVVFKKVKSYYIAGRTEGQETSDWVKFRAEWL